MLLLRDMIHTQILGQIGWAGGKLKYVKYNIYATFYTVLIPFFSILSTGQTAALAHTLNGSNDVFPHKDVPFGG